LVAWFLGAWLLGSWFPGSWSICSWLFGPRHKALDVLAVEFIQGSAMLNVRGARLKDYKNKPCMLNYIG
jgi:hypothetical protein